MDYLNAVLQGQHIGFPGTGSPAALIDSRDGLFFWQQYGDAG